MSREQVEAEIIGDFYPQNSVRSRLQLMTFTERQILFEAVIAAYKAAYKGDT